MLKSTENGNSCGHISEFYNGKSIFITGASGFFGTVLLETLLRCCPGIQFIYILLREKKGVKPENRKAEIFKKSIFDSLKSTHPNVLDKVHVIPGDVSVPDLGISMEDMLTICRKVSIVFHAAACINFVKSYRYILPQNAQGASCIVELCKKLMNLDALVFTSTVASNTNRQTMIREIVYSLPFPSQWFIDELKNGTEESLERLIAECHPKWPNAYTFSKALSENILLDNSMDMPIGIIRPAFIGSTARTPFRGYIEDDLGIMPLFIGICKGFVRVIHGPTNRALDIVPADVCANAHVIAAWTLATRKSNSPLVINIAPNAEYEFKLAEMNERFISEITKQPLKESFQTPGKLVFTDNYILYRMTTAYEHYTPAYVMDCFLILRGKKPRFVKMYKFMDKIFASLQYFIQNTWYFETQNFHKLSEHLDETDKMTFNISLSGLDVYAIAYESLRKLDCSKWESEDDMRKHRKELARRKIATTCIKTTVLFCICLLLGFIFYYLIPTIFSLY